MRQCHASKPDPMCQLSPPLRASCSLPSMCCCTSVIDDPFVMFSTDLAPVAADHRDCSPAESISCVSIAASFSSATDETFTGRAQFVPFSLLNAAAMMNH